MENDTFVRIGGHKKTSPTNILMLKTDCNYTFIYFTDGSHILTSTTMGVLEKRLENYDFFRPNRSTIINLRFIADFEEQSQSGEFLKIRLKNDTKIAVSRRKTMQFLKIMS